jgi:hypothetical protein
MESKKINIKKLMDFKNIYDSQLPNESINKEVMSKVGKKLIKKFKIQFEHENKKMNSEDMILFMKLILKEIDYKLICYKTDKYTKYKITKD